MEEPLYNINNVTKSQIKLALESLLFAASVDVNSSWYKNELDKVLELALNLRQLIPDVALDNVYIVEGDYYDSSTEKIREYFPEIVTNKPEFKLKRMK
jgi:hypothetical protein